MLPDLRWIAATNVPSIATPGYPSEEEFLASASCQIINLVTLHAQKVASGDKPVQGLRQSSGYDGET